MTIKMGYTCSCGVTWGTDDWPLAEAHLNANTDHVVTESYFHSDHNSGVPSTSVYPATAAPGSGFDVIIRTNPTVTSDQLKDGCLEGLYSSTEDLPHPPSVVPGWAFIDNKTSFPSVAWWQKGSTQWDLTVYPYKRPPSPLGTWVVSLDADGTGNNTWTKYSMGTEVKILSTANSHTINAVAFQHGTNGEGDYVWALFKSTSVSTSAPSLSSYHSVTTGTYTVGTPGEWQEVALAEPVTVAENEWYAITTWGGYGGQSASLDSFRKAGLLDETYAKIYGGVYAYGADSTAPGSNVIPTNRSTSTLYGIATLRISG